MYLSCQVQDMSLTAKLRHWEAFDRVTGGRYMRRILTKLWRISSKTVTISFDKLINGRVVQW